jgi:signal transduction histidine kinase
MSFQKMDPQHFDRLLAARAKPLRRPSNRSDSAFIQSLTSVDRSRLAELMYERTCGPGDIIFREGDSGDEVYLIRSGQVAIVTGDLSSPAVLGYRGPGEVLGEMALLEDRPRSASVIALDQMRLLQIDANGFKQLLEDSPAASLSIMASLSVRLREAATTHNINEQVGRQLISQVTALQHENKELLELQRVRQETSDLIIHDLRSPLGLMYSAVQMLEMVLPEDQVKANWELFDVIRNSYTRMQNLVDSLLDVAKMESGEIELDLAPIDFQVLVDKAVSPSRFAIEERGIKLHTLIPADLPELKLDKEKFIRVFDNLIDNAVKAMPSGGTLSITAGQQEDEVRICITDTGSGIPPAERERIFERFTQAAGGTRPRGFGLGLVFCRLTVEAHGGRIWVEPGPGDIGSRFIFTVPLPVS